MSIQRSELQGEDDPKCPNDPSGLHCLCIDIHDRCCDCPAHITADGDLSMECVYCRGEGFYYDFEGISHTCLECGNEPYLMP